jgi:hypothetical protein
MKAKDVIAMMSKYDPEEEVFITYWDKYYAQDSNDLELTDKEWVSAVKRAEEFIEPVSEAGCDVIDEAVREIVGNN